MKIKNKKKRKFKKIQRKINKKNENSQTLKKIFLNFNSIKFLTKQFSQILFF